MITLFHTLLLPLALPLYIILQVTKVKCGPYYNLDVNVL